MHIVGCRGLVIGALVALFSLAGCGTGSQSLTADSTPDPSTEALGADLYAQANARLECRADEGSTELSAYIDPTQRGAPSPAAAIESGFKYWPASKTPGPVEVLTSAEASGLTGDGAVFYFNQAKDPDVRWVEMRSQDRIEGFFLLAKAEGETWLVESFSVCNLAYRGSLPGEPPR